LENRHPFSLLKSLHCGEVNPKASRAIDSLAKALHKALRGSFGQIMPGASPSMRASGQPAATHHLLTGKGAGETLPTKQEDSLSSSQSVCQIDGGLWVVCEIVTDL
jgi:hypothetical protein